MRFFCYLGAFGSIGLYWFSLEHIYISLLFYFFGLLGFWGSLVFYNSYLPDIAFKDQQDKVSAKGFSLGYIGSVTLLLFNLAMVMKPDWFGFDIGQLFKSAIDLVTSIISNTGNFTNCQTFY